MAIDFASKRRFKNFQVRKVREALPEYFTSEFPKLVSFVEKYYDFLVALENHEISNGFLNKNYEILNLNYQMFQRFSADLPDVRAKEPNRKIALYFKFV